MTISALVVGCDAYPHLPGAGLRGAVADALAVRQWLLRLGGVRDDDLRFLASCSPDGTQVPSGVSVDGPADMRSFALEVESLVTRRRADRVYVYVAGHGCRTEPDHPYLAQDALVFTEFDADAPERSCVAVKDLTTQLAQGELGEIVVILDCSRGFPFSRPIRPGGFGRGWQGSRRTGAAVRFLMKSTGPGGNGGAGAGSAGPPVDAPASDHGAFTTALLAGLNGSGAAKVFDDADRSGQPYVVRWASLDAFLQSALPGQEPITMGQDSGLVFARFPDGHFPDVTLTVEVADAIGQVSLDARYPLPNGLGAASEHRAWVCGPSPVSVTVPPRRCRVVAANGVRTAARTVDVYADVALRVSVSPPHPTGEPASSGQPSGNGGGHAFGEVNLRSPDPNAMLTIEDLSGTRKAVGVGSIKGSLPVGSYTAVLADPSGIDPRIPLDVTAGAVSELVLEPADRLDGFRADPTGALRWSSPAAQLAAVTRSIWANGHRAFLLVGGSAAVDPPAREIAGYPQRFERAGRLLPDERGWWVALPVRGPWRSVQLGGHRITVPAAPDSVSAVAFTAGATTVALFDTTHAEPAEIAAQDRVQEYLATGRLGAADLTSRFAVEAGQRWPWGAAAAIRRLIDRTRLARTAPQSPRDDRAVVDDAVADEPPQQFVADVPPDQRHRLLGLGPWAVWLDWP